jgi:fido (protein-threonine AMPylation protein)
LISRIIYDTIPAWNDTQGAAMNDRQKAILDFVKQKKSANRREIQNFIAPHFAKTSRITIIRDLDILEKSGNVKKTGVGRAIRYEYSVSPLLEIIDADKYFAKDADNRKLISDYFNFDIWNNLHDLLSSNEKAELALVNEKYLASRAKISPVLLKKETERITVELAWKSSQIEGNTYTLLDTEHLIKGGTEAKGKTHAEAVMILNHKKALEYVFSQPKDFAKVTLLKIENLHRLLVGGLDVEFGIRNHKIGITSTKYQPLDNVHQIQEALEHLIKLLNVTGNPIEKAMIAVLMISYIQPFEDGNKRTSRILGNALLLANDYCPLSYRSVSEEEYKKAMLLFYEQNSAYYFKQIFINQFKFAVDKYF